MRIDNAHLEQSNFETLHSELAAKMNFTYSSFARTRLAPSSVRAFSKWKYSKIQRSNSMAGKNENHAALRLPGGRWGDRPWKQSTLRANCGL